MEREYRPLPEDFLLASGASVSPASFSEQSKNVYKITDYGASVQADAVRNTGVINELILRASKEGGGRVIVPEGIYP
ncbi:MAG: hypothetical protein IJV14_05125, partial [Lachnospiraceae bacterium]|nr:hypothetical protein [Lachnospiraceae bacterium]